MPLSQLPALLSAWLTDITAALDRRSAPRLLLLLVGALFAKGRRTVTSWFRAADITTEFRLAYNALWAVGRQADALAYRLLCLALKPLMRRLACDHILFAIDDTPTARYGPKVQGAGAAYALRHLRRASLALLALCLLTVLVLDLIQWTIMLGGHFI